MNVYIFFFLNNCLQAVPHSRREFTDSLNDETFGSSEFTSEDRAEEERKRRGICSFIPDCLVNCFYQSYIVLHLGPL